LDRTADLRLSSEPQRIERELGVQAVDGLVLRGQLPDIKPNKARDHSYTPEVNAVVVEELEGLDEVLGPGLVVHIACLAVQPSTSARIARCLEPACGSQRDMESEKRQKDRKTEKKKKKKRRDGADLVRSTLNRRD
jgi:hypothetical protein